MDFKSVIFNAAKDGKLARLRLFLDHKPKAEVKTLVCSVTLCATPLVISCRKGYAEIAQYLVEECCADIEQVGSVTFDGETIEDAPPLWCAAAAGHFNIVKMLVRHKASLNSSTITKSTPLRAACFDGHYQIVKYLISKGADIEIANRHGHTCLMIACYKGHFQISEYLLHCGAEVNRESLKGNTALHDCAESGNLEIFRMLLQHGAKFCIDSRGMTPLLSAAVTGHATIVEFLIRDPSCKVNEKVDALELLGATIIDKRREMITAHNYWKRAMMIRYEDVDSPLLKPLHKSPIAAYVNASEVTTYEQLEELISEPDAMRMQALIIRERILGPSHPDTTYYIRYCGAAYADTGHFDRCIYLWMYALDVQQEVLEPQNSMIQSSLMSFAELFSFMMNDSWAKSRLVPGTFFHDILNVFHRAIKEIGNTYAYPCSLTAIENNFDRTLTIVMHLVGLMCMLQPHLSSEDDLEFKQSIYNLIQLDPRLLKGWTLLHIACSKDTSFGRYPAFTFPSVEVAELLLEVGASPNAIDKEHNTPLHIAALNRPFSLNLFKTLLYHGAHLDLRNINRQTALQLLSPTYIVDIFPLRHLNLQCLCAQVIRNAGIPYHRLVSKKVENFLNSH